MLEDRDGAWTLLREAEEVVRQAGVTRADQFNLLDLAVYKISVARMLGDFGTAVEFARLVDPSRIKLPERRAR